ncbi:MAG: hypothetical protein QFE16_11065 [Pseudomonadota bacterium]|nr:hypothetical protein [Pseudomonadota bacterium]
MKEIQADMYHNRFANVIGALRGSISQASPAAATNPKAECYRHGWYRSPWLLRAHVSGL